MEKKLKAISVWGFVMAVLVSAVFAKEFPYRKDYPMAPPISSEELFKEYEAGNAVIVDVRSAIEYNVIHIDGAVHIPISSLKFIKEVGDLIAKNPGKKFAFYCNGVTCLKSYEAVIKAIEAGYKECYVYDAGIPEWVNLYPRKTLLLGKPVVDPAKELIPPKEFNTRCLSFEDFKAKASGTNSMIIDVRDHIQSSGSLPGIEKERKIPLDIFIPNFVEKKVNQDKMLLIFDQVGKQIEWLQYYLVANGYKNYYFLEGGATKVLKKQLYK